MNIMSCISLFAFFGGVGDGGGEYPGRLIGLPSKEHKSVRSLAISASSHSIRLSDLLGTLGRGATIGDGELTSAVEKLYLQELVFLFGVDGG